MNCHDMDSILNDHGAEPLSAAERAAVDAHLAGCKRCAAGWSAYEALRAERPAAPRSGLWGETVARLARERAPASPAAQRARWRPAAGLAAAAAAVALVVAWPGSETADDAGADTAPTPRAGTADAQPVPAELDELLEAVRLGSVADDAALRRAADAGAGAGAAADADRVLVVEFFMFGCFHCFAFEPLLEAWDETNADYIEVVRVPAIFNRTAALHAQAYFTAVALGKIDEMRPAIYTEIHDRGNPLNTEPQLEDFFARFGVDARTFRETFDSPQVLAALQRAETLGRAYRISATPSIVVAGRDVTTATDAGSYDAWLRMIDKTAARYAPQ